MAAGRRAGRGRRDDACSTSSWPPRCWKPAPTAPTCCWSATPAQLPSIGPGGCWPTWSSRARVPVIELTTLYRQAAGGAIARLATAVRGGELPPVDAPDSEVVLVPATGVGRGGAPGRAAGHRLDPAGAGHPGRRGAGRHPGAQGTGRHARAEQGAEGACSTPAAGRSGSTPATGSSRPPTTWRPSRPGSPTARSASSTEAKDGTVTVEFASGPAAVTGQALADLRHGWAVTVHRAQGSEWPAVVAVLPPEAGGMLSRPLVYTALTRAQRHLSVVPAVGPALARAVRRRRRPAPPDPAARAARPRTARHPRLTSGGRGGRIAGMSPPGATADYEYVPVRIPPGTDRGTAAVQLSLHAEYGGWELSTVRLHADGTRQVTLRRRRTSREGPPPAALRSSPRAARPLSPPSRGTPAGSAPPAPRPSAPARTPAA